MKRRFRTKLMTWYNAHRRDLPWRATREPYRIWLSEIMLQQTRVAAVIEHYHEFLKRFPGVENLASAREESVLAAWSGLGYYRRARMLHAAAKEIARRGEFPQTSRELAELPGIGRYTSAAISSIAFNEPVAVVDGNVERVLQRLCGTELKSEDCWKTADQLLDAQCPGDFNQAMMELGAIVCLPRVPACLTCPVVDVCATRGDLRHAEKPPKQKKREIHFALFRRNGAVRLVRRAKDASLMAGMWELPEVAGNDETLTKGNNSEPLFTVRHSITVTDYRVHVWLGLQATAAPGKWVPVERLSQLALTGLTRKILRKAVLL